jgi:Ni,Fe-hydrogenase maturation factor
VEGIEKVKEISLEDIKMNKCCSLHDFDLAMSLKLMEKMGKLKKIRIIGIPFGYSKKMAVKELKKQIPKILSS